MTAEFASHVWDLRGPPNADPVKLPWRNQVNAIAFHPGGQWIATSSNMLALWPMAHAYPYILRGHEGRIRFLVFDPKGVMSPGRLCFKGE